MLPSEKLAIIRISSSYIFMIKWLYFLKVWVKRALYINLHNTILLSWLVEIMVWIAFICRYPLKSRKTLNFAVVDHIKLVKRALLYWLKGHSKHNYIIRNRRYVSIDRLNQLGWAAAHDAKVSFVNSFNDTFWFFDFSFLYFALLCYF